MGISNSGNPQRVNKPLKNEGDPTEVAKLSYRDRLLFRAFVPSAVKAALEAYLKPLRGRVGRLHFADGAPNSEQWAVCTILEYQDSVYVWKEVLVTYDGSFNKVDIE